MKNLCVFLVTTCLLASCSSQDAPVTNPETAPVTNPETAHTAHAEPATTHGLALNGEERWQADEATKANLRQLQDLMRQHQQLTETNSLAALNELGQSLQLGFKAVFADCQMKGPEHDMLHTYLMPILADVKVLSGNDLPAAAKSRDRLALHLSQYQTYFQ
ncbi:hypothetical protein ACFSC6_10805 [Rufibacter sediminis]|uniref:Uncharacterized protein n=1 Tax=Rufibacter sediminis TaxID=2762756 RepID=A0ABR6VPA7_9BACT|nr:hypothetical protein [Rufibacter sediminis]MBC3539024.1 hypothetical protein [Rufibacter sediminis]